MNANDGLLHRILFRIAARVRFRGVILGALCIGLAGGGSHSLWAAAVSFGPLTVDALNTTGVEFQFVGTLTQDYTLDLTASGVPCLQPGPVYCVNAAGVVVDNPGTGTIGAATSFSSTVGGTTGTWDYGSLLMEIGNTTVQVFPANVADGLGSSTPPSTLTLSPTTLSALGFTSLDLVNPMITFLLVDDPYYDNSGEFTVSGKFALSPVPEPNAVGLVAVLLCALAGVVRRRRVSRQGITTPADLFTR